MTLLPSDVISTGTPPGMGQINPGDIIEIEIEQIGVLTNTVAAIEKVAVEAIGSTRPSGLRYRTA